MMQAPSYEVLSANPAPAIVAASGVQKTPMDLDGRETSTICSPCRRRIRSHLHRRFCVVLGSTL
jgi:hypothetical protein